jgi:coatomer protein complex subunit alpha (xenin)
MVNAVSSSSQAQEAQQAVQQAAQYVLAMSIELERRKIVGGATDLSSFSEDIRKRSLELSAYFTVPDIEPQHQTLALFSAMNFANKNKQLGSVLNFANALIERGTNAKFKETVSSHAPFLIHTHVY